MKREGRKGQITIFIILAIVVVAVIVLIFLLRGNLSRSNDAGKANTPENFIQTCLEETIKENAKTIGLQGGSMDPKFYYLYKGEKLQYLCYTNQLYENCYVQVPFITKSIEEELKRSIQTEIISCFNSLRERYSGSSLTAGNNVVELLPERILVTINNSFTYTQADQTSTVREFRVVVNNNLYELSRIASSIVDWEARVGRADPTQYMALYPDIRVISEEQVDSTTIYYIENKETKDVLQFASRSFLTSQGHSPTRIN